MSHGEFEKQVRDKMNEIHLQPSESVWSRVEHGLDAGKKRRRIIIWVPVMIILGIGFFLLNTPYRQNNTIVENHRTPNYPDPASQKETAAANLSKQKETFAADPSNPKESSIVNPPPAGIGPSGPPVPILPEGPTTETEEQRINEAKPEATTNLQQSSPAEPSSGRRQTVNPVSAESTGINDFNKIESRILNREVNLQPEMRMTSKTTGTLPTGDAGEGVEKTDAKPVAGISPLNQLIGMRTPEAAWMQLQLPQLNLMSEKKVSPGKKKDDSKYSFNINIAGGISHETDGRLLGLFQAESADLPTPLFSSPNTRYKAAPIDPGIFISAGLSVERKLGRRFAVETGLQYSRFSNSIMVGNRMQQERQVFTGNTTPATISTYYTPAPIQRYVMHFDFVDLPLSVLYTTANDKMKIHAGTAASALISSNALHFDAANGVYFENNDLLNKMQLSLSAGIKFRVPVKNSNRLYLGPEFRYQFSGLLKDNSNEKHLWSGAIKASWQLNK